MVVTRRPLGVLLMDDEAGGDAKLLAVPISKILPMYDHWQKIDDVNPARRAAIQHFFEHYKDLEPTAGQGQGLGRCGGRQGRGDGGLGRFTKKDRA